ncbi:MAG TPA: SRPBCC family protein [Mycobacteriales bacterium]|nr:SRPBCC family protein [Mycobacteriales bacterium]
MSDVEVSAQVPADPVTVWGMVSDVTRMGQWSPETTSCRWLDGADGPAPGARFRGSNKYGFRRWSTTCTVTDADEGKRFGFDVAYGGTPISHWDYTFTATDGGTTVTESWTDRRPTWMRLLSTPVMGIADRAGHNRRSMQQTLESLKAAAAPAD